LSGVPTLQGAGGISLGAIAHYAIDNLCKKKNTNSTKKVQKKAFMFDNWRLKISLEKIPSSPLPILLYEKAQK
jgi:hypothetical protein